MKKRFVTLVVLYVLLIQSFIVRTEVNAATNRRLNVNAEKISKNIYECSHEITSIKKAEKYATIHIDRLVNSKMDCGNWDKDTKIDTITELYDENENISSYCVSLVNKYGNDVGYIVLGANSDTPPIIEYSTTGKFFIDDLQKGYYFGGVDYFIKDKYKEDCYINVTNNEENVIPENDIQNTAENYADERDAFEDSAIINYDEAYINDIGKINGYSSSNPPQDGSFIYNPFIYENGWISVAPIDVNSYNNWYFSTSDFQGYDGHCAPTAATNLIRYWFLRNTSKYAPLISNWQWWQIFGNMYIYMKTNDGCSGTYPTNIHSGLKRYIRTMGLDDSGVKINFEPKFYDVVNQLDNGHGGRPFIYCVYNHHVYSDHAMLALGYVEFEYADTLNNKSVYSRYIRVADGWSNSPDRFVHFSVGQKASSRVIITFKPIME